MKPIQKDFLLYARTGKIPQLLQCLENGAEINFQDTDGSTALMHAAYMGRTESVRVLLARGADPNLKDKSGEIALNHARVCKRQEIVKLLEPVTDAHSIRYDIDRILAEGDSERVFHSFINALRSEKHRSLNEPELTLSALNAFMIFACANGFEDQLWQGGFDSIIRSQELMEKFGEAKIAAKIKEAVLLIREQARRKGVDERSKNIDSIEFDDDIRRALHRLDDELFAAPLLYTEWFDKAVEFLKTNMNEFKS